MLMHRRPLSLDFSSTSIRCAARSIREPLHPALVLEFLTPTLAILILEGQVAGAGQLGADTAAGRRRVRYEAAGAGACL